ncbi:hypothetical protein OESDEN_19514 [Oesophagostomum dentatum]|uniref:Uncharacterized protein n=1 Tax=Oesophagostomum dentatum TaxID=61180 RepID=A0A0B1SA80_OESDE|nr:hypothetical protein OESDEN_19514 [Oesophagostomum dentatum]
MHMIQTINENRCTVGRPPFVAHICRMHIVLLLALAVTLSLAYDPVFVDELEDLVLNKQDEQELDKLDDDKYMKR